jgi:hypothetical protein
MSEVLALELNFLLQYSYFVRRKIIVWKMVWAKNQFKGFWVILTLSKLIRSTTAIHYFIFSWEEIYFTICECYGNVFPPAGKLSRWLFC